MRGSQPIELPLKNIFLLLTCDKGQYKMYRENTRSTKFILTCNKGQIIGLKKIFKVVAKLDMY
jgi:hypothetical protein